MSQQMMQDRAPNQNAKPWRTAPRSLLPALLGALLALALNPVLSGAQNPPPPAEAQAALQQALQQNPGLADVIRQRLQQSRMTPDQIRARLQASGYPASLLDAYLGAATAGQAGPTPGT